MTWFLDYAEKVMTGLAAAYDTVLSVPGNLTPAERLVYFVRLVANSGFWVQHRSALRIRTDSGMLETSHRKEGMSMAEMKDQKLAAAEAEERMKLIAPLLSPGLSREALAEMKQQICEEYRISERTLRRYLQLYREGGFERLKLQGHEAGEKYKIPQEVLEEAIRLRREQPNRSIPTIIQILELEGVVPENFLKRSTLQDAFARAGYTSSMMKMYQNDGYASQRFQRKHRHDLWQGDIKYGPVLKIDGKPVQTYFSCLIDDCTRYILHGEFHGTMNQSIVEDTLHRAIQKYGVPRRLYFDNGSQYRTHWMTRACGLLGIRLLSAVIICRRGQ